MEPPRRRPLLCAGFGRACRGRGPGTGGPRDRRRLRSAVDAGCGCEGERVRAGCCGCRCHCCCHRRRCCRHLRSRAAPAARWICVADAPGSSCCRGGLRRAGQPARQEGGAAGSGRWVGACAGCPRIRWGRRGALTVEWEQLLREPCAPPQPSAGVSRFFFFVLFFKSV